MKTTTCKDLKGACDTAITGDTPEEMGQNSRKHVEEMIAAGDQAHIDAVEEMKQMTPEDFKTWHADFEQRFPSFDDA